MFYFTLCIFNNNISQVPRLEAVQDVQRQHPDSAGHAQAALLHRQVSASTSVSKSSIRRFVITEKAPTRAFSWLKAATTTFTFKTLLKH